MARTTWEGIEPYVFQQHLRREKVRPAARCALRCMLCPLCSACPPPMPQTRRWQHERLCSGPASPSAASLGKVASVCTVLTQLVQLG